MPRWLKHIEDGYIFDWNEILANHPKLREVSDEELFPEKYAAPQVIAKMEEIKAKHGKPLDLFTDIIPEEPVLVGNEELNAEVTTRTRKRIK
jgi:hypothetical protein